MVSKRLLPPCTINSFHKISGVVLGTCEQCKRGGTGALPLSLRGTSLLHLLAAAKMKPAGAFLLGQSIGGCAVAHVQCRGETPRARLGARRIKKDLHHCYVRVLRARALGQFGCKRIHMRSLVACAWSLVQKKNLHVQTQFFCSEMVGLRSVFPNPS